jgi:hypothetical protein
MGERVPAAIAGASSIVMLVLACTQTSTTVTPTPAPRRQPVVATQPRGEPSAGPRVPLTDSARRVRDSTTAARRDSGEARLLREIAGRENLPAESVFKNIKILKGVPARRLLRIMNVGFGRSLGVNCGFCHVPGKWDLDDKQEKGTARLMFAMVGTINRDYMAKVTRDSADRSPAPPVVNCMTCHLGNPKPLVQEAPAGNRPPGVTP